MSCASNLHQIYIGAAAYSADWDDQAPAGQPNDNPLWLGRQYAEFSADGELDGWGVMWDNDYINSDQIRCPANPAVPAGRQFGTQMYGWTHYNYRWNSTPFVDRPRVFADSTWADKVIFTDDASYGINWGGFFPDETEARVVNPKYWAHVDGGNAVRHDGSARYVRNFWDYTYPTSPDSWPNYYRGWPCSYYWYTPSWPLLEARMN